MWPTGLAGVVPAASLTSLLGDSTPATLNLMPLLFLDTGFYSCCPPWLLTANSDFSLRKPYSACPPQLMFPPAALYCEALWLLPPDYVLSEWEP